MKSNYHHINCKETIMFNLINCHRPSIKKIMAVSLTFVLTFVTIFQLYSRPGERPNFPGYQPTYERALESLKLPVSKRPKTSLFKITNSDESSRLYDELFEEHKRAQEKITYETLEDSISPFVSNIDLIDPYTLKITFNEKIDSVSTENSENYKIFPDIKILGAKISSNPKVVFLRTDRHVLYRMYTLVAQHIYDTAQPPNEIHSNPIIYYTHHLRSIDQALNHPKLALNHICCSDRYFIDSDFWYLNMLPKLDKPMSLKAAFRHGEPMSDSLLTLDVSKDITVIIGSDDQIPELPQWLHGWKYVNFTMTDSLGRAFDLYFRHFKSGGIVLCGHSKNYNNIFYIILNDFNLKFKFYNPNFQELTDSPTFLNPFQFLHKNARIKYDLKSSESVAIEVFDSSNRRLRTIKNAKDESLGEHYEPFWDGLDDWSEPVSTGLYLCKVSTGAKTNVFKIAVLN